MSAAERGQAMKKHHIIKTIQLIIFTALTVFCLYRIFTTPDLYRLIGTDSGVHMMAGLLWLMAGLSFLFIFLDFTFFASYKKDYRELDYAVRSDPVAGIANRYSCDALIESYMGKPLPDDMCCVMLQLTNIRKTNQLYGHLAGNSLIRDFSDILIMAQRGLCFVGRNGGDKFLAVFETASEDALDIFLERIEDKVQFHNRQPAAHPIEYGYGTAVQADVGADSITDLIAYANKHISVRTKKED